MVYQYLIARFAKAALLPDERAAMSLPKGCFHRPKDLLSQSHGAGLGVWTFGSRAPISLPRPVRCFLSTSRLLPNWPKVSCAWRVNYLVSMRLLAPILLIFAIV